MADLFLGVIGFVFLLASTAVSLFQRPKGRENTMDNRRFTVSTYGKRLPLTIGVDEVAGNIIDIVKWKVVSGENWNEFDSSSAGSFFRERRAKKDGPDIIWYTCTFALSLGRGPIKGITRVKINGKVVYNTRPDAPIQERLDSIEWAENELLDNDGVQPWTPAGEVSRGHMNIYLGTTTQSVDPVLEAYHGTGNVPAYRNQAYIVFKNIRTRRIESVDVEYIVNGTVADLTWEELTITAADANAGLWSARQQSKAISFDDRLFLFCGNDGTNNLQDVWSSLDGETWKQEMPIPDFENVTKTNLGGQQITTVAENGERIKFGLMKSGGGSILVIGGEDDSNEELRTVAYTPGGSVTQLDAMSPNSQGYFQSGALPKKIADAGASGFDEVSGSARGHIIGGRLSNGSYTQSLFWWGGGQGVLEIVDSGLGYTSGVFVVQLDGEVYAIGGTAYDDAAGTNPTDSLKAYKWSSSQVKYLETSSDITGGAAGSPVVIGAVAWNGKLIAFVSGITGGRLITYSSTDGAIWAEEAIDFGGTDHLVDYDAGAPPAIAVHKREIFVIGGARSGSPTQKVYKSEMSSVSSVSVTVDNVLDTIFTQGELSSSDLTLTDMSGDSLTGYTLTERESPRESVERLEPAFFFDVVNTDGKIKAVKRGGASVVSIPETDLGPDNRIRLTRKNDYELPQQIDINYIDVDNEYEVLTQNTQRIAVDPGRQESIDLPIGITADKAKQIAEVLLDDAWIGRTEAQFQLPFHYVWLEPADVVTVTANSITYTLRINEMQVTAVPNGGPAIDIKAVVEDLNVYSKTYTGISGNFIIPLKQFIPYSVPIAMDLPIFTNHDDWGFYLGAITFDEINGYWRGATLYAKRVTEADSDYKIKAVINRQSFLASTLGVLSDGPSNFYDDSSTVNINIQNGSFTNRTVTELQNGYNLLAIGYPGAEEICAVTQATDNGDGTWQLGGTWLRGLYGTEYLTGTHQPGERVVLLDDVVRVSLTRDESESKMKYKLVTEGKDIENATAWDFENKAIGKKPLPPFNIEGVKLGSGDWRISWHPRVRGLREFTPTREVREPVELYEIEFIAQAEITNDLGTYAIGEVLHIQTVEINHGDSQKEPKFILPLNGYYYLDEEGIERYQQGQINIYGATQTTLHVKIYMVGEWGRSRAEEEFLS